MPDPDHRFLTTRWSLVAAAGDSERAREALGELARTYWFPLYAFARHLGVPANEAEDVVQSFFARLLETRQPVSSGPASPRSRIPRAQSFLNTSVAACGA